MRRKKKCSSYVQRQMKRNRKKTGKRAAMIVAMVLAVLALVYLAVAHFSGIRFSFDENAKHGLLPEHTQGESAQLRRAKAGGGIAASLYSEIVVERDGTAALGIECYPESGDYLQVSIALAESGTIIYESGVLRPDEHIEKAPLKTWLSPGIYGAVATFQAISPLNGQETDRKQIIVSILVSEE